MHVPALPRVAADLHSIMGLTEAEKTTFISFTRIAFRSYVAALKDGIPMEGIAIPQLIWSPIPAELVAYALHIAKIMARAYMNPGNIHLSMLHSSILNPRIVVDIPFTAAELGAHPPAPPPEDGSAPAVYRDANGLIVAWYCPGGVPAGVQVFDLMRILRLKARSHSQKIMLAQGDALNPVLALEGMKGKCSWRNDPQNYSEDHADSRFERGTISLSPCWYPLGHAVRFPLVYTLLNPMLTVCFRPEDRYQDLQPTCATERLMAFIG